MVSVARRNLFREKPRLLISMGGLAFSLLLILALDGLVAGSLAQLTAYIRNTGADVYVAQPGVRTMHMSASALPISKVEEVRRVEGVARVEPILYASNAVAVGDNRSIAYVIGFDPRESKSGPWRVKGGSADLGRGEAVVDGATAGKLGVELGDDVLILGATFRVRGLSVETSNFVNSLAFIRLDDFAALRGQSDTASYLLVWLVEGLSAEEGARRINAVVDDVGALTSTEFASEEGRVVRDMSAEIMVIMSAIGFLIGLAAVGLTVYTATLAKLQEYGMLKALGASNTWLYRVVFEQALWSVAIGVAASIALAFVLSALFAVVVPDVPIRLELESVTKVILGAAAIAIFAASVPITQIARLDPVAVFRR
ncbi:MAG: ABC transporter permease [Chloroflexi bacterium]|nr:ABC transporter permease [Chloroflexota bacterium]